MEDLEDLKSQFHGAMVRIYEHAKSEIGYDARRFVQMVSASGGLEAARKLLRAPAVSDGFTRLWELRRLDLSVENHVLSERFRPLFHDVELEVARKRLRAYGFDPDAHAQQAEVPTPIRAMLREGEEEFYDIEDASQFEQHAREVLSKYFRVELLGKAVPLGDGVEKKFDLVSADGMIVGDAKYFKSLATPAAKWSVIAEYVWLLQRLTAIEARFLVFGRDRDVPARWLTRFAPLTNGVEFYFLGPEGLTNLKG